MPTTASLAELSAWTAQDGSLDLAMTQGQAAGPDFMCVGMQKAGTGWLYDQLRLHEDFWMPPIKELHYFDQAAGQPRKVQRPQKPLQPQNGDVRDSRDLFFIEAMDWIAPRPANFDEYRRLFKPKGKLLSGDVTPGYSTLDDATIHSIAQALPSLKVVLFVRDPVERFWSALEMAARKGHFAAVGPEDVDRVLEFARTPRVHARSFPTEIASKWQRHFPQERFRLHLFDDVKDNPAETRADILRFLGGNPDKPSGTLAPSFNRKSRSAKQPMSDAVRRSLAQYFAAELHACAAKFGGAASRWPAKYAV